MKGRQFTQKLSLKLATEISNGAIENAKSLYEDAKLLYDNEKYARAISLAILSIEESGKLSIIRSILLEDDSKEISKLWKSYRRHQDKNSMWIVPELIFKGATKLDDLRKVVDKNSDHFQILDDLKQLCFYSDVFTKGKLSVPKNVANKKVAQSILDIAKINITDVSPTEESLEIWVKHLKPVWKQEMHKMKLALKNCYLELEAKKIIKKGMASKMEDFLAPNNSLAKNDF
ncbi:MAG: AbiV family abortive infection protein [Pseudosphingobacterium sp.]|nr:AbiV family abortive infection protein [Pseudosphingobacterium sp.]